MVPTESMTSLLKNGLFVRRRVSNAILRFLNWMIRGEKKTRKIPAHPQKILICNIAHFGDVVISTAVLPVIKKQYPDCEIGFLTSTASSAVVKNHPLVSQVHCFDHWYLNLGKGKCKAALHGWFSWRKAVDEVKKGGYDLAIDLYSYFPNAIPLLAKAEIPVRIGYPTGGFSNLLTHPVEWNFADQYVGYAHLHLLTVLGIDVSKESPLPSYQYKTSEAAHIVAHIGSLNPGKEWEMEKWVALIRRLQREGHPVVLTGKGEREGALCKQVAQATGAKDMSNQLTWPEFVLKIQESRLLISVDSAAVHVAAGSLTPTVVLFSLINRPQMWVPPFSLCQGIVKTEVDDAYQAAMELLCKK